MQDRDAVFMEQICRLAQKSRWQTFPNPNVGACLVRDDTVVARGYHHGAGLPHAEIECLKDARERGIDPSTCTLYVTLEPCNHYGRTPPCTRAVLEAGIPEVVFGMHDPNPTAQGGAAFLASQGVTVRGPVAEDQCHRVLQDFLVWQTRRRPYVILKMAETMDGRIATRTGHSRWISGPASRSHVHSMRRLMGQARGAVLIGGNTFRLDNPALTARCEDAEDVPQPRAVIITSSLPEDPTAFTLLRERPEDVIFCTSDTGSRGDMLRDLGCTIIPLPKEQADLPALFQELLARSAIPYLYCEGGGILAQHLLTQHVVDELHLYLAPLLLCDNDARPVFTGAAPVTLEDGIRLETRSVSMLGEDVHIVLQPCRPV